jgi:hypothetical protein
MEIKKEQEKIPKNIFTYWDTKEQPDFIKICIKSWQQHYSDFKICIYDKEMALNEFEELKAAIKYTPQSFSDLLRLLLLYKYGGCWLDASLFIFSRENPMLNNIENLDSNKIHGYNATIETSRIFLANWFIIGNKQNQKIKLWLEQSLINFADENFEQSIKKIDYPFKKYAKQGIAYLQCFDLEISQYSTSKILMPVNCSVLNLTRSLFINDKKDVYFNHGMLKFIYETRMLFNIMEKHNLYLQNSVCDHIMQKNNGITINYFNKFIVNLIGYFVMLYCALKACIYKEKNIFKYIFYTFKIFLFNKTKTD